MGELTDGQPLFPGESEINQIEIIHETLGNFPSFISSLIEKRKDLKGINLKENMENKSLGIYKRFKSKLSDVAFDFLKKCLE
jgi:cyclin-dependent kinase-like